MLYVVGLFVAVVVLHRSIHARVSTKRLNHFYEESWVEGLACLLPK